MNLAPCIKLAHGRCVSPEETLARLEPMLGAHHDIRLHEEKVAEHLYWSAMFVDERGFRSMGKGISAELSRAGAYAEGAEWLAARELGSLPGYTTGHQEEIENALSIEEILGHISTATPAVLAKIKNLDRAQYWVDGYSLVDDRVRKVPLEYIRQVSGPNGHASGNRVEEAIVHATHEVFERRAHITVLRDRLVMPTIDPETIAHPVIREQIAFVRDKGIEVVLKDLSFGGHLPCIGAYFLDKHIPEAYQFHHFFKVGASFNRENALMRIFTEYTQGRRLDEFLQEAREEEQQRVLEHDFRALKCMDDAGDNYLSAFMFGFVPMQHATFLLEGDLVPFDPGVDYRDCLEDIDHAREICRTLGKDYIVVDLTDPEMGFPVVAVVIPGYSDVLPYHPATSKVLFEKWSREEVLDSYPG